VLAVNRRQETPHRTHCRLHSQALRSDSSCCLYIVLLLCFPLALLLIAVILILFVAVAVSVAFFVSLSAESTDRRLESIGHEAERDK